MIIDTKDGTVSSITMRRPSNFHAHFRSGAMMKAVTPHILRHVRHALAMPNTGPLRTIPEAVAYHADIMRIVDDHHLSHVDTVITTLYLTDEITPSVIEEMTKTPNVRAVKYYPPHQGATTGSGHGIPLSACDAVLRAMEDHGIPLLGHFEDVVDANGREIPPALREGHMVKEVLWKLRDTYPQLRICFEHASTVEAVKFVKADTSGNTVMTVTPQHSLFTQDDFDDDTLGTHLKCMPIVKTLEDRLAILEFITTGDWRAIAGDDTAPHPTKAKELAFGEAANGCWLPHAIGLYAQAFEEADALDFRFERFMSLNGPTWWSLQTAQNDTITIERVEDGVPEPIRIPESDDTITPLGWTEQKKFPVTFQVAA